MTTGGEAMLGQRRSCCTVKCGTVVSQAADEFLFHMDLTKGAGASRGCAL